MTGLLACERETGAVLNVINFQSINLRKQTQWDRVWSLPGNENIQMLTRSVLLIPPEQKVALMW